jgi:nucleoid DNA-binding protein
VAAEHREAFLAVVHDALLEEDSVLLKGIGRLAPRKLAAKRGVTPKGKAHSQPARLTLRIVTSGIFKARLNANRRVDGLTRSATAER